MQKRNWKIVYSSYSGVQKRAIELIYKEMGALILRDKGRYTIHVLACENVSTAVIDKNAVVVGLYNENEIIRKHISANEIKKDGYVVKVMDNPENPDLKLVLITANTEAALFYGAVDFVDDYFALAAPKHGGLLLVDYVFEEKLPDYYISAAPAIKTRSVFTWGTPINDYRDYIDNMARLKLNQLIIWNDFVPLNADDIVDYAHSYGIQVIWGFAWGWTRNCATTDLSSLDALAESVLKTYRENYMNLKGDGIYFQSFTETWEGKTDIEGKSIAEIVVGFVNNVSGKILEERPNLSIQFGLHAMSVKEKLEFIAKTDKRVEIMWEDCGTFPYHYDPEVKDEQAYKDTLIFTDKILDLRDKGKVSMLVKGFMTLDWVGDNFVHQAGPYVLGDAKNSLIEHDKQILTPVWRRFQAGWLKNGKYAYDVINHIYKNRSDATLGMAGQFAGGLWFVEALCAQMLFEADKPYDEILNKVLNRRSVDIV